MYKMVQFFGCLLALAGGVFTGAQAYAQGAPMYSPAQAQPVMGAPAQVQPASSRPVLVISNNPVPKSILEKAYSFPTQGRDISPSQIVGSSYYKPTETMVSRKLRDLKSELAILQDKVVLLSQALSRLQRENEGRAAEYFAAVATINTQLQVGTTPGNPRLLQKFSVAEQALDALSKRLMDFNNLSIDASKVATEASFLLDSARATYGLSGAVEEDHVDLASMEDKINTMIVLVERVLNTVSDDISRTRSYMQTERDNLRVLSLAIANGSLYGLQQANRPFSGVRNISQLAAQAPQQQQQPMPASFAPSAGLPPPPPGFFEAMQQQGLMPAMAQPQASAPAPMAYGAPSAMAPPSALPVENIVQPMPQPVASFEPAAAPVEAPVEAPVSQVAVEDAQAEPLVKIKFDRTDVAFEKPLHMAVSEVLNRYPEASFNVVSLHSSAGGAASAAIESTRSRRNAQKVSRSLSQLGVADSKVSVSYEERADLDANEVHLFIY